ncbi:MAG: methyltransferase [Melioribacteraceae bacterium]
MSNIDFDLKKVAHYDDLARKVVFGYDQLFIMALSLLAEKQNETANVLIVGCGTGMELITFGNHMTNWKLTGVDPSEEMIKISRAKINDYGLSNRVTLHHGFIESLLEAKEYDAATLIFVLRFIPDDRRKLLLFQNIAKRLRSGAKLIIVDQYGDPSIDGFQYMSKAWKNFMKLGGTPTELVNKIMVQAIEQNFVTERELQNLLLEAGFEKITRFYNSFVHGGWVVQKK